MLSPWPGIDRKSPSIRRPEAVGGDGGLVHRPGREGLAAQETIAAVAEYLGMAPMAAYEVASFYNMYDLHPVGKYKITVCTNLPCALSGRRACRRLRQGEARHRLQRNHSDGKFTLKEGECMGACGDAPVMLVNNKRMCSFMLPEQIDKLLAECK
jgi:NADH-quinone oxidoreductase subunit E